MPSFTRYALLLLLVASCSEYGRRQEFNNGELFYTGAVRYNEAYHAGKLLMRDNMFFDGRPKSVQLDKQNGRFIFRVVEPDQPYVTRPYENLAYLLSSQALHGPVDVEICDNEFRPIRKIPFNENIE
jgi:hypothetical protein